MEKQIDFGEQYDKIYRYCYFKVRHRETAEDLTQETFLRFLGSGSYAERGEALHYLYTIAHHLCVDEFRRRKNEPLTETEAEGEEEDLVTQISVRTALTELDEMDRELLLLRYVNEVPVSVIGSLYGMSRFSVYRRILQAEKKLKEKLV